MFLSDVRGILNSFNETSKEFMGSCVTAPPDDRKRAEAMYNALMRQEEINCMQEKYELETRKAQEERYQKRLDELQKEINNLRYDINRAESRVDGCTGALVRVSICFAASLAILALVVIFK